MEHFIELLWDVNGILYVIMITILGEWISQEVVTIIIFVLKETYEIIVGGMINPITCIIWIPS